MPSQVEAGSYDAASPSGVEPPCADWACLMVLVAALSWPRYCSARRGRRSQLRIVRIGSAGLRGRPDQNPGGVAVDPTTGDVYVADTGDNRVDEFSATGSFVRAWGWGVVDGSPELQVCTTGCEYGLPGKGAGEINGLSGWRSTRPTATCYTINGRDGRVQRFSATGAYVEASAGYGAGDRRIRHRARAEAQRDRGRLRRQGLRRRRSKYRIVIFDSNGALRRQISAEAGALDGRRLGQRPLRRRPVRRIGPRLRRAGALESEVRTTSKAPAPGRWPSTPRRRTSGRGHSGYDSDGLAFSLKEIDPAGKAGRDHAPPLAEAAEPPRSTSYGLAVGAAAALPRKANRGRSTSPTAPDRRSWPSPKADAARADRRRRRVGRQLDRIRRPRRRGRPGRPAHRLHASNTARPRPTARLPGRTPANSPRASIGEDVGAHLTGLAPGATYHFNLVAENAEGTVESRDHTFTTYPIGGAQALPDGRAYELRLAGRKGPQRRRTAGRAEAPGVAGGDEAGMAYLTMNGLAGLGSGRPPGRQRRQARRAKAGATSVASPPELNQTTLATGTPVMFSEDLTQGAGHQQTEADRQRVVRHQKSTSTTSRAGLPTGQPEPNGNSGSKAARRKRGRRLEGLQPRLLRVTAPLTPESRKRSSIPTSTNGTERSCATSASCPAVTLRTGEGVSPFGPELHPVSEDGSSVVFGAEDVRSGLSQVFRRSTAARRSRCRRRTPASSTRPGRSTATFVGAAANGSSVFFTSSATLTADAETGENGGRRNRPGAQPLPLGRRLRPS